MNDISSLLTAEQKSWDFNTEVCDSNCEESWFEDFIGKNLLGIILYNYELAEIIYQIIKKSDTSNDVLSSSYESPRFFYTHIAEDLGLDDNFVLLIKHILSGKDLAEFGGNPGSAWLTVKGEIFLEILEMLRSRIKR